jgi:4-amino-4-deoxy-L-arabinose transferase-like glycosyltransferase
LVPPAEARRANRLALLLLSGVYLALALPYSLLTRAWEANDELDHATYIEYIVRHGALPRISALNGHESHQPPLYYLLAAGWQKLLGIPAFKPSVVPNPNVAAESNAGQRFLEMLHNYTPVQHQDAVYLHELRLLSVLFGLATVLLSYGCARLVFARAETALSAGLLVALLPKQLVVDSVVTNDTLVITLCALALFIFLLSEKARQESEEPRRRWLMFGLGVTLGLAAITKLNSLPLAGLLLSLTAVPALRRRRLLADSALAVAGALAASLWWFVRNIVTYGQFLASRATLAYLKAWLPPLVVPVSWTNTGRFLHFVPSQLFRSVWYDGGWNQFDLPKWMNLVLWILAALSMISAAMVLRTRGWRGALRPSVSRLALCGIAGAVLAGIAAVLVIAQTTTQAEGRVAFVGLVGFAILLVLGTAPGTTRNRLAQTAVFAWPAILVAVNIYVFSNYLVPLGGL